MGIVAAARDTDGRASAPCLSGLFYLMLPLDADPILTEYDPRDAGMEAAQTETRRAGRAVSA